MTDVLAIRTVAGIQAVTDEGKEVFRKWKLGDVLLIDIRKPRNSNHHRKFFALLNITFENQNRFPSLEALRTAVIIDAGWFNVIELLDGNKHLKPKSISFASMKQNEFDQLYSDVINSCLKLLSGTTSEDLEREIAAF